MNEWRTVDNLTVGIQDKNTRQEGHMISHKLYLEVTKLYLKINLKQPVGIVEQVSTDIRMVFGLDIVTYLVSIKAKSKS